jgi:DNA-directed RNA polymerase subunit RPC12/RpoP
MAKRGRPRKQPKAEPETKPEQKRQYIQNIIVNDEGAKCPHCGNRYKHTYRNKYPNGNQRMKCGECGKPFMVRRFKDG